MNTALLAAYAELDALRLAAADDECRIDDAEIFTARQRVWRLENRLARRRRMTKVQRAAKVQKLLTYCLEHRTSRSPANARY